MWPVSQRRLRDAVAGSRAWPATRRPGPRRTGRAPAGAVAAHVVDRRHRDRRRPGRQRRPHPRRCGSATAGSTSSRRSAAQLTAIGQLTGAVRDLPRAHPARADVAQPVARPGLRDGRPGRRPSLARASRRSGCCSAHGVVHHRRLRARRRQRRRRRVPDAHHDLPVRPDGAGQRRPVRGRRDQLDPRGAAPRCRTRRGTASTCTPTSRSRSGSSTSSSSARTSSTTRSPSATGSRCTSRPSRSSWSSAIGQPVWLSARHRLRVVERRHRRRRASSRST